MRNEAEKSALQGAGRAQWLAVVEIVHDAPLGALERHGQDPLAQLEMLGMAPRRVPGEGMHGCTSERAFDERIDWLETNGDGVVSGLSTLKADEGTVSTDLVWFQTPCVVGTRSLSGEDGGGLPEDG